MKKEKNIEVLVSLKGADEVIDKLRKIKELLDDINNTNIEVQVK